MHLITTSSKDEGSDTRLVATLYEAVPTSLVSVVTVATSLAVIQWPVSDPLRVLLWLSSIYLVSGVRLSLWLSYVSRAALSHDLAFWKRLALAGALLSGATWGSAAILLFPPGEPAHQMFVALCIAGMASGAVTTLSAQLPAVFGFLGLSLLPLTARFLLETQALGPAMGFMSLLFFAMLTLTAVRFHRKTLEALVEHRERRKAEALAHRQALYDELTQLPNRRLLMDRLDQEVTRALRHGRQGAVFFLDLDRFKHINDSLGHSVGDQLLQQVAERICKRIRGEDTAARLGGDEFVVLLPEIATGSERTGGEIHRFALELQQSLNRPYVVAGHEIDVTSSIGIAVFPDDGATPNEVLKHADMAMYRAKEQGRSLVQFFLPGLQAAAHRRLKSERDLRRALDRGELVLVYQSQVNALRETVGLEALLRWRHPQLGLISPAGLLRAAEDTGLILPLGEHILRMACRDLVEITGRRPLPLSINVSPKQFRQADFVDLATAVLTDTGADPALLRLEITESTAMENIDRTIAKMQALRDLGVRFAIDDFGTGHSSLAHLKRLPIDTIKIDGSFLKDIVTEPDDAAIVEAIIAMARHLQLDVIAEGVESRDVLEFLLKRGCRQFQGFLFSKPAELDDLLRSLDGSRTPRLTVVS
ncbi:MAG: EAL domain-containing protein [Chromatiaceae bacterium]